MHIASSEEIQFYQKCLNLGKRIDGRLPNQLRSFELCQGESVINTSNGSSRLFLPEENLTILVGIKADVVSLADNPDQALVTLKISSSQTKSTTALEKAYMEKVLVEMQECFQSMLQKYATSSKLVLVEKKLAWNVHVDLYIDGAIGYANMDHCSFAIRAALESCILPEVDVNLNSVSNEYTFTVKDTVERPFYGTDLPHFFVGGYNRNLVFFDLNPQESLACECLFLASILPNGQIQDLRKIDGGDIRLEGIVQIVNELGRYSRALYRPVQMQPSS